MRIEEITDTWVHVGYRRVHVMLRREGYQDTVEQVSPTGATGPKACRCV